MRAVNWSWSTLPTYTVRVYMGGDIQIAKHLLRHECWDEGLCVTIEPSLFIYTGGEEQGFVIGFVNYPRFPAREEAILARARVIAQDVARECAQRTALVVTPYETHWLSRELPDA